MSYYISFSRLGVCPHVGHLEFKCGLLKCLEIDKSIGYIMDYINRIISLTYFSFGQTIDLKKSFNIPIVL